MEDPRSTTPQSIMPAYPWLLRQPLDWGSLGARVKAQVSLGVPYRPDEVERAADLGRQQAQGLAREVVQQGGPAGLEDRKVVALVAYLQRLGTDIKTPPRAAAQARAQALR
jgi:cytochrome c oxidase cbb3-type subunit I/II